MGSFSYGSADAAVSGRLYRYYLLEPYMGAGYYPMDGFEHVDDYGGERTLSDGMTVYGCISYLNPLSFEQMDAYCLCEASDEPSVSVPESPSQEKKPDVNRVMLSGVPSKFVFPTKNPQYMIFSVQTPASESGYGNIALPSSSFVKESDGTYMVDLGRSDMWRNMSVKKNGSYEQVKTDVKDIQRFYLEQSSVHQLSPDRGNPARNVPVTSVYLNYVDSQFIYPTKNPDYKIVSVPYTGSENGFAKITVSSDRIFPTVNTSTHTPVPGKFSVNLGDPNGRIGCSIKKDGNYEKIYMTASEVGKIHLEKRRSYMRDQTSSAGPSFEADAPSDEDDMLFE